MKKPRRAKRWLKLLRAGAELGVIVFTAIGTIITLAAFWELYRSGRPGHGNALFIVLLLPLTFYLGWFARRAYSAARRQLAVQARQKHGAKKPPIHIIVDKLGRPRAGWREDATQKEARGFSPRGENDGLCPATRPCRQPTIKEAAP